MSLDCKMSRSRYIVIALLVYFNVNAASVYLMSNDSLDAVSINNGPCKGGVRLPVYWDWRAHNGISSVKDQMGCGAGYAFSALANIESQIMIRQPSTGETDLSEQFIIDCNDQNAKCDDASVTKILADIVVNMGGVLEESDYYPYENGSDICRWDGDRSKMHAVTGFQKVPEDEDEIKKFLVCHGPLSAAINPDMMEKYVHNSGVIDQPSKSQCPPEAKYQRHAVLVVGYGLYESKDKTIKVPYWIIKNSWGKDWGDDGYYYIERGTNACGIANDVSFATVPSE